jgi:EAL domain-containing protein (putative c-di-GMP-specific phosphodiesterase class I)
VGVNVSGRLFSQADMVDRLVEILERTGLDPASLRLEFAENVVADQGEDAISRLMELRALGVRLSVDDFGSGFASLALIDRFKFDALKIDPGCLRVVNDQGTTPTLLETILTLARSLDMGVIAEGVETSREADYLRRRQCPHGQGFWFSHPLDPPAAEQLLHQGAITLDT